MVRRLHRSNAYDVKISLAKEIRVVQRFYLSWIERVLLLLGYGAIIVAVMVAYIHLLIYGTSVFDAWQLILNTNNFTIILGLLLTVTFLVVIIKFMLIMSLDQLDDKYIQKYVVHLLRKVSHKEYRWFDLQSIRSMAETDRNNVQNLALIPNTWLAILLVGIAATVGQPLNPSRNQSIGLGLLFVVFAYLQIVERANAETVIIQGVNQIERERNALAKDVETKSRL